jgi:hypothetical protein
VSLIWSIKKLFDPLTHRREEGEAHAEGEEPRLTPDGDPPGFDMAPAPPPAAQEAPASFRCRLCGHRSADGAYCPACLADTMMPED